jgi:hypothetical protein
MNHRPNLPSRRRITSVLAAAVVAGTALVAENLASSAALPTATQITIAQVYTPSITVPNTPGAGAPYVVKGVPFNVDITTDYPLSYNKAVTVVLTVTGPDSGVTSVKYDVPVGATSATIPDIVLPTAANNVTITVAVDARKTDVAPGTRIIDVLRTSLTAPADSQVTGWGGGGGPGVRCSPTADDAICGDLELPDSSGVLSPQLLSQGASNSFLQLLVDVDPAVYNANNPILVIAKCDKTKCKGKGIRTYSVSVQISPNSPAQLSPPCTSNGVIDTGDFCTDYVHSTRDNAGDLLLRVLLRTDAKIIF